MSDVLAKICADKRHHIAERKSLSPLSEIRAAAEARNRSDPPRGFRARLERVVKSGHFGLIAEIKRASPSKGLIRADFDPPSLARAYAAGGATCLSVLTDKPYFQGEDGFLDQARKACALPALRKDFMLDPYQVFEARAIGADCILLIMAALDDALARQLYNFAKDLGMDVLVEIHDEEELQRALALSPEMIGVNNRSLKTLEVDIRTSHDFSEKIPPETLKIAESGLSGYAEISALRAAGYAGFLVGESLMRQPDIGAAVRSLLGK